MSNSFKQMGIVALSALAVSACDTAVSPSDSGGPTKESVPIPAGIPRSYFILQSSDLTSPGWPDDYEPYDLFICNPSMTAAQIATVRQTFPGVILLAYVDLQALPIYRYNEPYYQQLTAIVDTTFCMMDLSANCMLRLEEWRNPEIIFNQESADVLVAFHRDVTMAQDWDGIYLDQCTLHWPVTKRHLLNTLGVPFDINGDGIADSMDDLDAQYETWRPYFTSELRRLLRRRRTHPDTAIGPGMRGNAPTFGQGVILLGNSARDLLDPALNGITFEAIGIAITVDEAITWGLAQKAISVSPKMLGSWARFHPSELPSLAFAESTGAYYGTMIEVGGGDDDAVPDIP